MQFRVVVRLPDGSASIRTITAPTAGAASEQACLAGGEAIACEAQSATGAKGVTALQTRPTKDSSPSRASSSKVDLITLAQDVSSLLDAGLSITETLGALRRREKSGALRELLDSVLLSLSQGKGLADALAGGGVRSELFLATVTSSEQTGTLASSLSRFAGYQLQMRALRGKLVGACIYPCILAGVGLAVALFLLGFVIPRFSVLIEGSSSTPSGSTQTLLWIGSTIASNQLVFWTACLFSVTTLAGLLVQITRRGLWMDVLGRIPVVAAAARDFQHLQMYRTCAMLGESGLPLLQALKLSAEFLGSADRTNMRAAVDSLQEGQNLASAFQKAGFDDPIVSSMLAVAERSGDLASMLGRIAILYEGRLSKSVELISKVIEPLMMVFIGLFIGILVVLMYLPIFDLATSFG